MRYLTHAGALAPIIPPSSAGTRSSGGSLVAAGEMYLPATHCNSLELGMSVTFFLSERSYAEEKCYGGDFCQSPRYGIIVIIICKIGGYRGVFVI